MTAALLLLAGLLPLAALPPGPGPFGNHRLLQPVPGAPRALTADGWKAGKLCDVSKAPYSARNGSNATAALSAAIADCGGRPEGGTVLVPSGLTLLTGSLFMRSNLTLRVETGATLLSTATGSGATAASIADAPLVYARRNCLMTPAHAGLVNGGRCIRLKDPLVGWDDCAEWEKLENVVIEGGGMLDADGDDWYNIWGKRKDVDQNRRPMMLDMMWVDGLTIRDMQIRRPGYWTVHPTFSNNVRVTGNSIITYGANTDGCDPDSSWNVYIARNTFSTGDDCIAIKAGRDWSGRMVNISTQNVLAEGNFFEKGHGVSIGSETSGWIRNVTIKDSVLKGTNLAVRIKTSRGRGGGVEDVLYENLRGSTSSGIMLNLHYGLPPATNWSATPELRNVTVRNLNVHAGSYLTCNGLPESVIEGIFFDNVSITTGSGVNARPSCGDCSIRAVNTHGTSATPCSYAPTPPTPTPPPPRCKMTQVLGCYNDSDCGSCAKGTVLPVFQPQTHDRTTFAVCASACADQCKEDRRPCPLAGIDGGNHCYCGTQADLDAAAKRKVAPSECDATTCRGDPATPNCGGQGRLVAYSYSCKDNSKTQPHPDEPFDFFE